MAANQLRLWFSSFAYVLMAALRRLALQHTAFETATCGAIRLKLLKIGARVTVSVRRIKIAMASACPYQTAFTLAHARPAGLSRLLPNRNPGIAAGEVRPPGFAILADCTETPRMHESRGPHAPDDRAPRAQQRLNPLKSAEKAAPGEISGLCPSTSCGPISAPMGIAL